MAEGSAKIAALRAASDAAPAAAGGPAALAYPWMARQGAELVIPTRAAAAQPRPAPQTAPTVFPAHAFRKATNPPEPRPAGAPSGSLLAPGGRFVTDNTPGFVDGVTLSREPVWNFNPTLLEDLMPRNFDAPIYPMPMPEPVAEQPVSSEPPRPEAPVSSSQMGMEPQLSDFQFEDLISLMSEAPVAVAPAVEVAPETVPYSPQIFDLEVPEPAPVRQPKVPQPMPQPSADDMLMRYYMMQGGMDF